jgi:hypothetical protein
MSDAGVSTPVVAPIPQLGSLGNVVPEGYEYYTTWARKSLGLSQGMNGPLVSHETCSMTE